MMTKLTILFFLLTSLAQANTQKKITFLIAEREYKTNETLPKFAQKNLSKEFSILFCNAPNEGPQRNHLSNPRAIENADLLFVSVRRRAFSEETMKLIRRHIKKSKPIIGIRTSSHAFQLRKEKLLNGHQEWIEWDRDIIGGNYQGHQRKGIICKIEPSPTLATHSILNQVKLPFLTPATLYRNSPLPDDSNPILIGSEKGFPTEPVAWTHYTSSKSKVFYTSLGHIDDFNKPAFNRLLVNAVKWCLKSN